MRFIIQRVQHASVTIEGEVKGKIGKGFLVLVGIGLDDDEKVADKLVQKLVQMRIFEDENGKTNLALKDVGGEMLLSLRCTRTAGRETVRPLRGRGSRIRRRNYMNILSRSAGRRFQ